MADPPGRGLPALPNTGNAWRTGPLIQEGIGSRAIKELTRQGALVRTRHGCYLRGMYWQKLSAEGRDRALIFAHHIGTLASSSGTFVYSHTSATRLHKLSLWNTDNFIHITHPFKPSKGGYGTDVCPHCRPLDPADVVWISGVRATSLVRTAIDCALTLRYKSALILMDHALRLGASPETMRAAADRLAGQRGVRTLRAVVEHADPRAESPGETLTRDVIRLLGIEPPEPQVEVLTSEGIYRLDFGWRKKKVGLEFDGKRKYFDYRPTDEAIYRERQREKALTEAGWTIIRIQWKDLFDEARLKVRLQAALRR